MLTVITFALLLGTAAIDYMVLSQNREYYTEVRITETLLSESEIREKADEMTFNIGYNSFDELAEYMAFPKEGEGEGEKKMIILCYPSCSTCKKAEKWLDDQGISYELRDIKKENPRAEELRLWYEKSGLPLKRFFNTSGLVYKNLNLKEKLPTMTEVDQLELLASDGMLVKRPLLIHEGGVLVGFKEAEWEGLR